MPIWNAIATNYFALCVARTTMLGWQGACALERSWVPRELGKNMLRLNTTLYFERGMYDVLVAMLQQNKPWYDDSLFLPRMLVSEFILNPNHVELRDLKDWTTSQWLYNFARSLQARGNKRAAEASLELASYLDEGWQDDLSRALTYYQLGRIYQTEKKWDAAVRAYKEALSSFLSVNTAIGREYSAYTHRRLGEILEQQGDPHAAIEYYIQSILVSPQHADFFRPVDLLLRQQRSLQDAYLFLADLRQKGQQDDPYLWSNSALVFIERGAPQMAERVLAEVPIELKDAPAIRAAEARLAMAQGKWTTAESLYAFLLAEEKSANSEDQQRIASLTNALGEAIFQQGRYAEALRWFDEATRLAPTIPKHWYNLGLAYQQLGRRAEARAAFEKALALNPDYAAAQKALRDLKP